MILTGLNNISAVFTNNIGVKAVYANGVLVWPTQPVEDTKDLNIEWYVNSTAGSFSIGGTYYKFSDYTSGSYGSITIPNFSAITTLAFQKCTNLTSVYTNALRISSYAFIDCSALSSVSLPVCSYIANSAFQYCSSLTSIGFPKCSYIGSSAFYSCSALSSVDLPVCSYIGSSAFAYCKSLRSVSLPKCNNLRYAAFQYCSSLISMDLPNCSYLYGGAFLDCNRLERVSLPVCSYIGERTFYGCGSLRYVYLLSTSVCQLDGSNVFNGASSVKIYVPLSLLTEYESATNWVSMSSRIYTV